MDRRKMLNDLLKDILESDNVYYDPPEGVKLKYPAIVYKKDNVSILHADNVPYKHTVRYSVMYIDKVYNQNIVDKIASLPTVAFDRSFPSDNLYHEVYTIYY